MWAVLVALIMIASPSFLGPIASCRSSEGGLFVDPTFQGNRVEQCCG